MVDRLIVDLGADGRVSVSSWLEGQLPEAAGGPFGLVWPVDGDDLEGLRWYLEDYLRAPFGVYGDRGPEVAGALAGWGEAVFAAVFGSRAARDAYVRVRARVGVNVELVFRSSSPALLGLPWELLRDPARPTPLAVDLVGVTRSVPASELGEAFAAGGERLRVLMVISRPEGGADVGYRMIARPLLERLEAVRGRVELVVLRPPTLEALQRAVAGAAADGEPFQVVHFDGHGVMTGRQRPGGGGGPLVFEASGGEGVLVFEKPGGGPEHVSASTVAQVLKAGRVPLVVLNACQSGAVGKELEAAVATRLLQEGAASVVAMAYSVYVVAAAEFMTAFYERLFAGDVVTAAVTAGRRRLYQRNERPSPKGMMPLSDWVVPVHYLRRELHFPELRSVPAAREGPLDEVLDRIRARADEERGELEPVGSFVGRDALFYELELAARLQRVVVLHGPGGTGKTELAKAFGRWWRDTGGVDRPDFVIFHSFEPGVASFGLDGVVAEIGLRVWGAEFARLEGPERLAAVEQLLQDRRLLLIWDNFESVFTMPDPAHATLPLAEEERNELREFLASIASAGRSSVIITSRTEEVWLGEVRRVAVGGLAVDEAIEYAEQILAPYPAAAARRRLPAFGELLRWLDGHPLSMRLVLRHLASRDSETLLAALQGIGELPAPVGQDGGRTSSLDACVRYSFEHLPSATARLLVAVCLFHGVADVDILGILSRIPDAPDRFTGADTEAWSEALNAAAGVGLLTKLGGGMYHIHPALPGYLAARWRSEEPSEHDRQRTAATRALLAAHATLATWLIQQIRGGNAGFAFAVIDRERRTLGHLLRLALDTGGWQEALTIAEPLNAYLDARGLYEEARGWVDRGRLAVEDPDGTPPALNTPAGALWLFLVGSQANREQRSGQLDKAERTSRDIVDMLQAQPRSNKQQRNLAACYQQLGIVAQLRGRLDDAEDWNTKSLTILEELGDRPGMASSYHQLGIVAQDRGRLDDAEDWYTKSLIIKEELGNRPGMASSYHQLGIVAQDRGRLDDAEDWYTKSLTILEELGDRPGMASSYDQLGRVAQDRGRLDDAEDWYTKSLTIFEELGNRPGMATTYGQLGLLAEARGQDPEALEWIVRCVALFDDFPHPATGPGPQHLARLTSKLGIAALATCWRNVTGCSLPQPVRDFVQSFPPGGE